MGRSVLNGRSFHLSQRQLRAAQSFQAVGGRKIEKQINQHEVEGIEEEESNGIDRLMNCN